MDVFVDCIFCVNAHLEGVFVVKKDYNAAKNPDVAVPNLQVIKALKSLVSKDLVKEEFNWQVYYFFLKEEGIAYLRSFLNLPETVVPDTIAKATMPASRTTREEGAFGGRGERPDGRRPFNKSGNFGRFNPKFEGPGSAAA